VRLTIGYRGTAYAGWAAQSAGRTGGRATLQSVFETALSESLGESIRTSIAGRTDAGVHADAQVVSFATTSPIPAEGLRLDLTNRLPTDVWVVDAVDAPADFDARRSAKRRWYRYAVWRGPTPSAAWHGRALPHPAALNLRGMRQAASRLLGSHDLGAVAARPLTTRSTVRTIFAADWVEIGQHLAIFEICADSFLKQMVRTLVGSLLWVGSGRWTADQFAYALASAHRRSAGPTAPAHGLTLSRIDY
jgi:tRNA pseudouridine38-40 synthase